MKIRINDFKMKCRITGLGGVGGPIASLRIKTKGTKS